LAGAEFLVRLSHPENTSALSEAFANPGFSPYLGRKAFAPSFPFLLGIGEDALLDAAPGPPRKTPRHPCSRRPRQRLPRSDHLCRLHSNLFACLVEGQCSTCSPSSLAGGTRGPRHRARGYFRRVRRDVVPNYVLPASAGVFPRSPGSLSGSLPFPA
jgi:hypothetical protein